MRKLTILLSITILLFTLGACKKKEEPAPVQKSPVQGPIVETPADTPPGHGVPAQKTEFQVVVPPEVEGMWAKVTVVVDDKKMNKKEEFTVKIGDEFNIPDSKLTVKIGPFFPDFKMSGTMITSSSNEPNNPAVGVAIFEGGTRVFPASGEWGWLYVKFPAIHAFQHERFALALKEGVKK
ncbi:MAG TPA: hypothetical protein DDX85_05880 [Nitrospiraceae bacterium]|nr:hypothetical protein [Nitrospiraceae bacterium]